ncbi:MAG: SAM-dependent chlorinase/fluorinase [Actinomycetota bacterium]|nr:SAM-dependent chlorinase/fluorinase [Actinomycetota bacterium]MDA2971382.1 SAM-dependent chlorinase/fluorinase [Actinomycetota bacterium]MDA3000942.1 SAM-dependent chlorinase/fluorinase [Actinomycetota bacterium]
MAADLMDGLTYDTVSFLSDLGHGSDAVGVVHALLRDLAPDVRVIDITHEVAPFDVRAGSLALARSVAYVPRGVVMACVDPGAGTDRRLVAVEVAGGDGVFIGPDNGLLATGVALAGGADRAVVLDRVEHHVASPGATFAARDVLAPVAAALALGTPLEQLGSPIDPGSLLPSVVPIPRDENGTLACEVLWVDRFGNCQINVSTDDVDAAFGPGTRRVRVSFLDELRNVEIVTSYGQIGAGALGLVVDASGLLSLSIDRASAAQHLGIGEGESVLLAVSDEPGGVTVPVSLRS